MCQIYVRKKDCPMLPEDYIQFEKSYNSDGAGIAYVKNNKIITYKSLDYDQIEILAKALEEQNTEFVIHFRMTTAGTSSLDNIHPFHITDNLVMFHNGTIRQFSKKNNHKSDTRLFAEYLRDLGVETIEDVKMLEKDIKKIIGETYDKLVFMDNLGNTYIINDWIGEHSQDDKLWSSSVCPFRARESKGKNHFGYTLDDDYFGYSDTKFDDKRTLKDTYYNLSTNELDVLQYMLDYAPKKLKKVIQSYSRELRTFAYD